MSNEFMREERYIVFKISDLGNSLKGDEIRRLAQEYAEYRQWLGKKPLECVVVESDWPEYEPTWKAIEARVTGAQPAPSARITALYPVISWLRNGCDPMKAAVELEMLAATPCAKGE